MTSLDTKRCRYFTVNMMAARPLGKLATACQFALAITVPLIPDLTLPMLTLTAFLSTLAAIDYWRIVRRALRAERG